MEYATATQPKKKRRRHHVATQPLSFRKFIMCFLCVLSRFGGYRVLTCTPCRRNRLSCKKEKRIVPLKCGHKFQWSTLQYSRRIIAGKRHQSLKSKWQSSKWLRTHRLLSETKRVSSNLESPIIQCVRYPLRPRPAPPLLFSVAPGRRTYSKAQFKQ